MSKIAVRPDDRLLATTGLDSTTVQVWQRFRTNGRVFNLAHGDSVEDITFSPDGSLLATASRDTFARLWDMKTGEQRLTLTHDIGVRAVAFSPDGRRLANAGLPVRIWDANTGEELVTFVPESRSADSLVFDVAFSLDGRWLVTASSGNSARIWDAETGEELLKLRHHHDDRRVLAVALIPDNRWLVTGSADGVVKVWRISAGAGA